MQLLFDKEDNNSPYYNRLYYKRQMMFIQSIKKLIQRIITNLRLLMNGRQRLQSSYVQHDQDNGELLIGVQGKFQWPIRIITPLLFGCTLLVNFLLGVNRNKEISEKFHLYVTPPGFFFSIWGLIYMGLATVIIYNLIRNVWNLKANIFFGVTNILNILWTLIFNIGTLTTTVISSFILISLTVFIFLTWVEIGNIPKENVDTWTYVVRNVFALYLGWCIAASNLNFGMDVVYWWGATKQTQLVIFWIVTPLCAIGAFTYNCIRYGKYGLLSCLAVWISVIWAFIGAAITSHNCLNGLQTLC